MEIKLKLYLDLTEALSGAQNPENFPAVLQSDAFNIQLSTEDFTEKELQFLSKMMKTIKHPDGSYAFTFLKTERNEQDGKLYNDVVRFHNTNEEHVVKTLKEIVFDNAWLSEADSVDAGQN